VSIGAIGYGSLHRFLHPEPLPGFTIAIVAGIGIVINAITAFMFLRGKDKDINVRSAYLHLLSDAMVSVALVIGGVVIYYTGLYWIDPLLSIIVAIVILISTWGLLRSSLRLSLDGVPENVDLNKIKTDMLQFAGVKDIHHIHVWGLSTTTNALTAHIVVNDDTSMNEIEKLKQIIKHELVHLNIHHATLEFEQAMTRCEKDDY
jgi:cobalt-zinc-cadmium efflux system protein